MGMFGRALLPQTGLQQPLPEPPVKKPSFFGQGGTGRGIAGGIGDFLLQQAGARPIYAPAMQAQHEAALQQAQAQQQREAGMSDWLAKQQWERDNPAPAPPRYFEANDGDQYRIGADGKPERLFDDPTPKIDYQWIKNPDGTMSGIPIPRGGAAPSGPPPGVTFTPLPAGGAPQPGARIFR